MSIAVIVLAAFAAILLHGCEHDHGASDCVICQAAISLFSFVILACFVLLIAPKQSFELALVVDKKTFSSFTQDLSGRAPPQF